MTVWPTVTVMLRRRNARPSARPPLTAPPRRLQHDHLAGDIARTRERFEVAGGVRHDRALGRHPFLASAAALFGGAFAHPFEAHAAGLLRRRIEFRRLAALLAAQTARAQRQDDERRGDADARRMTAGRADGAGEIGSTPVQGPLLRSKPRRVCPALCRKQGKTPKARAAADTYGLTLVATARGSLCRGHPFEIPPPVNPPRERIFNVPGAVLALTALLVAIHLVLEYLLTERQASELLTLFAFSPRATPKWRRLGCRLGGVRKSGPSSPMRSSTPTSIIFFSIVIWLLAFGPPIARRFGWRGF